LEAELAELKLKIEENELVYDIKRPRNVRWLRCIVTMCDLKTYSCFIALRVHMAVVG
jgi:hypothetical protein